MNTGRPLLHHAVGGLATSLPALVLPWAAAGTLLLWPEPVCAETVLNPANPSANFTQVGTQPFTPGTVLTLTDGSVGDHITLYANDALAGVGLNIDVVATFQFTLSAPANANANNRLEINDGTHAAVAQCLTIPGIGMGIGLYSGGNTSDPASYPVSVPVDWMSAPATIRLRRWANGDAELVEVNGVAPSPRALLPADQAPPAFRPTTSVGFGLASVEARATVWYSEFFSEEVVIFSDGFEISNDCAWNVRPGSSQVCEVTVRSIQTGEASGEVSVYGVVTAFTTDRKHFWVADGHVAHIYEGVFVYRGSGASPLDASLTVGSAVQVRGYTEEFGAGTALNSLTEIVATEEPLNQGFSQQPFPDLIPPGYLDDLADLATGEPYEGVLVRVDNVDVGATLAGNRVELVDPGEPDNILLMDDYAYLYGAIAEGTHFACVTGVMDLQVASNERRLLPRSAADLALTATGCPPAASEPQ